MQHADSQVSCETHLQIIKADGTVIDLGKVDATHEHNHNLLERLMAFAISSQEKE
jgi:hypothetical protein